MVDAPVKEIGFTPQPGFQYDAAETEADIAILGGAAGAGKTYISLLESLRNIEVPGFGAVFFRRTNPQIRNQGALLDTSKTIYPLMGGRLREQMLEWVFANNHNNKIMFRHLQHEKDVEEWQGSQIPLIIFDELTHFTEHQFWYMVSRNRSTCGVRPYIRATCNPDSESWVANFISWWINQETGYPIPERAGKLRYMIRIGGIIIWGSSKLEVYHQVKNLPAYREQEIQALAAGIKPADLIRSVTFIPGSVYGNKKLLSVDPGYLGALMSLGEEEQKQLLRGNWLISQDGLSLCDFNASKQIFDNRPSKSNRRYITCDAARHGRDFMVIKVWLGWEVVEIRIMTKSEWHEIVKEIELARQTWGVMKIDVMVDQDGVGGAVVTAGGYRGFHGGHPAVFDIEGLTKEDYVNFKTQCAYRVSAENINVGEIRINVTDQNVFIDGIRTCIVKVNGEVKNIKELIMADIRAWKRKPRDDNQKLQMNTKDEQKLLLNGRSPDFGDNILMRKAFDLVPVALGVRS